MHSHTQTMARQRRGGIRTASYLARFMSNLPPRPLARRAGPFTLPPSRAVPAI